MQTTTKFRKKIDNSIPPVERTQQSMMTTVVEMEYNVKCGPNFIVELIEKTFFPVIFQECADCKNSANSSNPFYCT